METQKYIDTQSHKVSPLCEKLFHITKNVTSSCELFKV